MTNNAVLLSVKPKWCELIANGRKTIEVRKTMPNIDTPFKCYIYCTIGTKLWKRNNNIFLDSVYNRLIDTIPDYLLNGRIIGEFICDKIYKYSANQYLSEFNKSQINISDIDMEQQSCLSHKELFNYECTPSTNKYGLLGWHIYNLIIYDKPKSLTDLYKPNGETINKAPQNWCYVKEI